MASANQYRAARAHLDIGQSDVAAGAGLTQSQVSNIEKGNVDNPHVSTLMKLDAFYESRGLEFTAGNGIREREQYVRILKGRDGFAAFMNDVYETTKREGGDILVSNVDERNWIKWMGQDAYDTHAARMSEIENFSFKILVCEGDDFFIASEIATYKWVPADSFSPHSIYLYGRDKAALIGFSDEDVTIKILSDPYFTDGYRAQFMYLWNNVGENPVV